MASLHFKVKEFDFGEKLWHPVSISWSGDAPVSIASCTQNQTEGAPTNEGAPPSGCQEIELPIGTPTNTLRKITFLRNGSFDLRAAYKDLGKDNKAADLGTYLCFVNHKTMLGGSRTCSSPYPPRFRP